MFWATLACGCQNMFHYHRVLHLTEMFCSLDCKLSLRPNNIGGMGRWPRQMHHVAGEKVDYLKNDGRKAAVIQSSAQCVLCSRTLKKGNILRKKHLHIFYLFQTTAFLGAQILQTCHVFHSLCCFYGFMYQGFMYPIKNMNVQVYKHVEQLITISKLYTLRK